MTTNSSVQTLSAPAIPPELSSFFEKLPLLWAENRSTYEGVLASVSAIIRPEDGIVWLFVKDFVDSSWEIQRWRLIRADLIKMTRKDALVNILESLLGKDDIPGGSDRRATAEAMAEKWFCDPDSRLPIRKILKRLELTSSALDAQAVVLRLGDLAAIEELIESAERRQRHALSLIEVYRGGLVARLRSATAGITRDELRKIPLSPNTGK